MTPEGRHRAGHLRTCPGTTVGNCPRCIRDRRNCQRKARYYSREEADDAARQVNILNGWKRPVVSYRCIWCLAWHLTKARRKHQVKRAEKTRRKWLIARYQEGVGS